MSFVVHLRTEPPRAPRLPAQRAPGSGSARPASGTRAPESQASRAGTPASLRSRPPALHRRPRRRVPRSKNIPKHPFPSGAQRAGRADVDSPSAPAPRAQAPGPREGREGGGGGEGSGPARAVTGLRSAGPPSALPGRGPQPERRFAPPFGEGVSPRRAPRLPSPSPIWEMVPAHGRGGDEGEGSSGTPSTLPLQLDTHAASPLKLRRRSPQRAAGRAPPPSLPGVRAPQGGGGRDPGAHSTPRGRLPKARARSAVQAGERHLQPAAREGRGGKDAECAPARPAGMHAGPAETHPRRISRAP